MSALVDSLPLRPLASRPSPRTATLTVFGVGCLVLLAGRHGYRPFNPPMVTNEMLKRFTRGWKKRHAFPNRSERARLHRLYEMQMEQRRLEPRATYDELIHIDR